jgi:hypothetical protein
MAITITSVKKSTFGNKRVVFIDATVESGDTSATVSTGLVAVDFVQAGFTDLLDKTVSVSASAGELTLGFTNPAATKIISIMVVGH